MEEQAAVARLRQGDIGGLATLVRAYQVRALRAAYLITRDRALAEDVVQAAFLRAYQRIDQFDPSRPFGPWFLRSVVNDAVKAASRHPRHASLERAVDGERCRGVDAPADRGPGPDVRWEEAETREELWAALGALTPAQREAIVLRYYLNLSEAEMADRLGCPPGTIKSRLHAARARLQVLLRPVLNQ